jgi:hypothetical protein
MCRTPSFEATHVVPQKKHTTDSAIKALLLVPLCLKVKRFRTEACRVAAIAPFKASLTLGKEKGNLLRIPPLLEAQSNTKKTNNRVKDNQFLAA